MPYINQADRRRASERPATPGELNYAITTMVVDYVARDGLCYETLNAAIGALECAKLELYRRVAAPYENLKIQENGDAYPREILR